MKTLKDRGFSPGRRASKICPAGYIECAKAWTGESARKRGRERLTDIEELQSPESLLGILTLVSQPRLPQSDLTLTTPLHI